MSVDGKGVEKSWFHSGPRRNSSLLTQECIVTIHQVSASACGNKSPGSPACCIGQSISGGRVEFNSGYHILRKTLVNCVQRQGYEGSDDIRNRGVE